ncbi:hypothetical protein FS749_001938 [Ceratobasidium sp. UAMH 11750]|nr:hypothetical protein FS749_001938 [Ceratobasidium sp. UAMH 11750]
MPDLCNRGPRGLTLPLARLPSLLTTPPRRPDRSLSTDTDRTSRPGQLARSHTLVNIRRSDRPRSTDTDGTSRPRRLAQSRALVGASLASSTPPARATAHCRRPRPDNSINCDRPTATRHADATQPTPRPLPPVPCFSPMPSIGGSGAPEAKRLCSTGMVIFGVSVASKTPGCIWEIAGREAAGAEEVCIEADSSLAVYCVV